MRQNYRQQLTAFHNNGICSDELIQFELMVSFVSFCLKIAYGDRSVSLEDTNLSYDIETYIHKL